MENERTGLRIKKKKIAEHIEGPVKVRNNIFVVGPRHPAMTFLTICKIHQGERGEQNRMGRHWAREQEAE